MTCICLLLVGVVAVYTGCDQLKFDATNSSSSSSDDEGKPLPEEDAIGEDMADITRYPDSVRTYYAKDYGEIDIIYLTKDSAQEVSDYYKDLVVNQGWTLVGEASDYLDFEKGDAENPEMLTIYFEWKKKKKQTEYEILYTPPLTEEELKEFEEDDEFEIEL